MAASSNFVGHNSNGARLPFFASFAHFHLEHGIANFCRTQVEAFAVQETAAAFREQGLPVAQFEKV